MENAAGRRRSEIAIRKKTRFEQNFLAGSNPGKTGMEALFGAFEGVGPRYRHGVGAVSRDNGWTAGLNARGE